MSARCACGGEPYVFPPHLEQRRRAMHARAVETGRLPASAELPVLCSSCVLKRLDEGLRELGEEGDVNAPGGAS